MMLIAMVAAAATAAAPPPKLHTYKDWIVGCDNVHVCQANALQPENGDDDYLELTVSRGTAPTDRAALSVPLPAKTAPDARYSLKVDGPTAYTFTIGTTHSQSFPLTGGLLSAMRNGRRAVLLDAGGKSLGAASLAGLAAALGYIDDQQGRVGTIGALKATGPKPDSEVPAPPGYPIIAIPIPSSAPPRTLSVAVAAKLIGSENATCEDANGKVAPRSYRLDATHSLVLIDHPCGNGAYNFFTSVYLLGETGPARPARFDVPPGMDEPSAGSAAELTNGDWDPKTRRLGSFEKGRGLGDCGTTESYVWDGARFRLVEQYEMDECRGSADYIRTWVARISR